MRKMDGNETQGLGAARQETRAKKKARAHCCPRAFAWLEESFFIAA
jgi:hypothetical protein